MPDSFLDTIAFTAYATDYSENYEVKSEETLVLSQDTVISSSVFTVSGTLKISDGVKLQVGSSSSDSEAQLIVKGKLILGNNANVINKTYSTDTIIRRPSSSIEADGDNIVCINENASNGAAAIYTKEPNVFFDSIESDIFVDTGFKGYDINKGAYISGGEIYVKSREALVFSDDCDVTVAKYENDNYTYFAYLKQGKKQATIGLANDVALTVPSNETIKVVYASQKEQLKSYFQLLKSGEDHIVSSNVIDIEPEGNVFKIKQEIPYYVASKTRLDIPNEIKCPDWFETDIGSSYMDYYFYSVFVSGGLDSCSINEATNVVTICLEKEADTFITQLSHVYGTDTPIIYNKKVTLLPNEQYLLLSKDELGFSDGLDVRITTSNKADYAYKVSGTDTSGNHIISWEKNDQMMYGLEKWPYYNQVAGSATNGVSTTNALSNIVDDNPATYYSCFLKEDCLNTYYGNEPFHFEVDAGKNIVAKGYMLYNCSSLNSWKINAKKSIRDEWTTIDVVEDNALTNEGMPIIVYKIDNNEEYRYYQFELVEGNGTQRVNISGFSLMVEEGTDISSPLEKYEFIEGYPAGCTTEGILDHYEALDGSYYIMENGELVLVESVVIPAHDHYFEFKGFDWSDNYEKCECNLICKYDKSHVYSYPLSFTISAGTGRKVYTAKFGTHTEIKIKEPIAAKDPSCTEPGNIRYMYDEAADKYFSANGLEVINYEDTVIQANGHTWSEWRISEDGADYIRECDFCDEIDYMNVASVLKINKQPNSVIAYTGNNESFIVSAEGTSISYQWQALKPGTETWVNSGLSGNKTNKLKVTATDSRNGYKFRCVLKDKYGIKLITEEVELSVIKPVVIKTQPKDIIAEIGKTAKFSVKLSSGTGVSYQWQVQKPGSTVWQNSSFTGNKTATLKLPVTIGRNGYKVRVKITDIKGTIVYSEVALLSIKPEIKISLQPSDVEVIAGNNENVSFSVKASSTTGLKLNYQWQVQKTGSEEWLDSGLTGNKTSTLKLTASNSRIGYKFRCVITDEAENVIISEPAELKKK